MKKLIIIFILLSLFGTSNANTLTRSVQSNSFKHVKALLRNGIDPNIKDTRNNTALLYASFNGNTEIVKTLLEYGANPNITDNAETSPLHLAIRQGNTEVSKLLIESGANINSKDFMKSTPIMRAIRKKQLDIIAILVENNADLYLKNNQNYNSFDLAFRSSNPQILRYLIKDYQQHQINELNNLRKKAISNKFTDSSLIIAEKIQQLEKKKEKKITRISFHPESLSYLEKIAITDFKEIPTYKKIPAPDKKNTIINYNNIKNLDNLAFKNGDLSYHKNFKHNLLLSISNNKKETILRPNNISNIYSNQFKQNEIESNQNFKKDLLLNIPNIKKDITINIPTKQKDNFYVISSIVPISKEHTNINKKQSKKESDKLNLLQSIDTYPKPTNNEIKTNKKPNNLLLISATTKSIFTILKANKITESELLPKNKTPNLSKIPLPTKKITSTPNNKNIEPIKFEEKDKSNKLFDNIAAINTKKSNNIEKKSEEKTSKEKFNINKNNISSYSKLETVRTNEWNIKLRNIPISTIDKTSLGHDRIFNRKFTYKAKTTNNKLKKQTNKKKIKTIEKGYYIQLGIFSNPKNANRYKLKASIIGNSIIKPGSLRNKKISKVMLGPYKSKLEAISIQKQKSFQDSFGKFTLIKLY